MEQLQGAGSQFIKSIKPMDSLKDLNRPEEANQKGAGFQAIFQNAWNDVTETRKDYSNEQYLLATGQTDDPHRVMIAASKAELSVELLVQLRNKSLEAYDQLIRTSF